MTDTRYDLIVVGSGVAGLSAAVTALEAGLKVVVLERSSEDDFGGNSRWTEAYLRMKNDSEIADDFEEHFAANPGFNLDPNVAIAAGSEYEHWPAYVKAHPFPDPELVSAFAAGVPETIAWLKGFGLRFGPQPIYLLTQNTTRIAAQGGGLEIITRLREQAQKRGATLLYRTTATDLVRDERGRVCGVRITDAEGDSGTLCGDAVVLASGGYQGNAEMMARYMGKRARFIRPVAPGGYYNRGEGIRMALHAGAAPAGDFSSYHAEPVDPRSRQPEAVVHIYPYGILLDRNGQRFLDESPCTVDASYDNISRAIGEAPEGIAYVVFDAQVEDIPDWRRAIRSDVPAFESDTIEGLATQIGLPVADTLATVEAFNAACPDSAGFDPFKADGLSTAHGLKPVKTHHARALVKAPFRAYPIIASNCFTFGGLKVNTNAQVLDNDGKAIRGLYAAGETVGIYHQVYNGSTSVLRGLTFGRIAGRHVAHQKQ